LLKNTTNTCSLITFLPGGDFFRTGFAQMYAPTLRQLAVGRARTPRHPDSRRTRKDYKRTPFPDAGMVKTRTPP